MLEDSVTLPPLREELRLEPHKTSEQSEKQWRLYDPLHHRLYLLDEADVTLLTFWKMGTVGRLKFTLNKMNILFSEQQIEGLLQFFKTNELTKPKELNDYIKLRDNYISTQSFSFIEMIAKLRSTRIPVFFIDSLLVFLDPIFNLLRSKIFVVLWSLMTLFGLYFSLRQWDDFINTAAGFYSINGAIAFAATLAVLKFCHEIGHAYFARHYGCKVGRVGIATFFMMPLLYTEMDDVTRLRSKRQRMMVSAGGVLVEILLAGIATFIWAVSDDGMVRNLAFLVATTCWVTSIFINLNPFAKYDGYYLLSDYLGIDNLQAKAIAWSNWSLDRAVLGHAPKPEEAPPKRIAMLTLFGAGTWLYQVFILSAVSLFFYHFFYPIFGLLWFIAMMGLFVGLPVMRNARRWWGKRKEINMKRRLVLSGAVLTLLLVFFVPFSRNIEMVGLNRHQQFETIYAPAPSMVSEWLVPVNAEVEAGQVIVRFYCPELLAKFASTSVSLELAKEQLDNIAGDPEQRVLSQVLMKEYQELLAQKMTIEDQIERLEWRASQNGRLVDIPLQTEKKQWVSPQQALGRIVSTEKTQGLAYIREQDITRFDPSKAAKFYPADPSWPSEDALINELSTTAIKTVSPPELSSIHGGDIASQKDGQGNLVPDQAYRTVYFEVQYDQENNTIPIELQGKLIVGARPVSLAEQLWGNIWSLLLSELRR